MTDTTPPQATEPALPVSPRAGDDTVTPSGQPGWMRWTVLALAAAAVATGWSAWQTQQRVHSLEQELVRRQQDSQGQATEARVAAKQAQELSREAAARATLLETRLAEVALQRTQVEDLVKNLSQSRDENLLADIESSLRVAAQQASLTGSADPIVAALQSADERLTRTRQPRLDNVRRAIAKDLDRVKATRVADLVTLGIRLDEAIRLIDEVPLLNQPEATMAKGRPVPAPSRPALRNAQATKGASAPGAASEAASGEPGWGEQVLGWISGSARTVWDETRGLVRLTRVDRPEAMLMSPEQGFFMRENMKLRLLNARVALLSRQTHTATADLQATQQAVSRYFDTSSRKTQLLQSLLAEVIGQGQHTVVPRPDDTLAALIAVNGGR
ncbi:uroporphyrinogen-III C-methyltransferase [uncultured Aquabacterium sp.]|uniref:uroporphyrinogen-III C-methyltransferase n=1 Tax=uncultured Aquabacterium sp. TaxID=158753 RepID=UPI00261AA1F9|nr:uroporphyrinogen-III C-methyltransferase [uncultured Aquabacterium sp.]